MVGAFFASPAIANAAAGFLLLMLVVNSGFVIVRTAIEPWVIWFYYLSPFAYSIRALAINEMTSPRWAAPAPFSGRSIGETALETFDFFTEECAPTSLTNPIDHAPSVYRRWWTARVLQGTACVLRVHSTGAAMPNPAEVRNKKAMVATRHTTNDDESVW